MKEQPKTKEEHRTVEPMLDRTGHPEKNVQPHKGDDSEKSKDHWNKDGREI